MAAFITTPGITHQQVHAETDRELANQASQTDATNRRPNVLVIISDDQSFPHASAYGCQAIKTPGFDVIANSGVLFTNAIVPSPGCSPMRAAFLSGRNIWQCGAAGTHGSYYPTDLPSFVHQLAAAGYRTGLTGKGWSPGSAKGWDHNPAGPQFDGKRTASPPGISSRDYAANFDAFLDTTPSDQPFCFWFGGTEPHRPYDPGLGRRMGIDPESVSVPRFLPDNANVRDDIADYMAEIQWFDTAVSKAIDRLKRDGLWNNTLVIITSDNGMPFPRAKANLYDAGIHVPLAISWPERIKQSGTCKSVVSLLDVTATILEASGTSTIGPSKSVAAGGSSLLTSLSNPILDGETVTFESVRPAAFAGRERHSSSRFNTLSYPSRCVRTDRYLYIVNERPERWPAGTPSKWSKVFYDKHGHVVEGEPGPSHGGYHDIDASPTMRSMIEGLHQPDVAKLWAAATQRRPQEELYDLQTDSACLVNLASSSSHAAIRDELAETLRRYRLETNDLRLTDPVRAEQIWEAYPRMSSLRWFAEPDWLETTADRTGPAWLEDRRPMLIDSK
ncbi:MAG: sulfatase [Planctomycetota bacterium]